ncbi:MAG: 1-acyl-sn-glycerol-3-phosphate acyltransferase [Bacteroidota bacterium]
MKKTLYTAYYNILKWLIRFFLQSFYRRYEIVDYRKYVSGNTPIIFTPNHQNALIDALNLVCSTFDMIKVTFLTRSDVFGKKITDKIFYSWQMLPVYRQRDGVDSLQKNEQVFEVCRTRLMDHQGIMIFPEGNHNRLQRVRALKKGVARIAFQTAEEKDFDPNFDLQIVPVGQNYRDHLKFHADMMVKFGEPIHLRDYYEAYRENPRRTLTTLTRDIRKAMTKLVIHIEDAETYDLVNGARLIYDEELIRKEDFVGGPVYQRWQAGKKIVAALENHLSQGSEDVADWQQKVHQYQEDIRDLRIRNHVVMNGPASVIKQLFQAIFLLIGLPFHVLGVVPSYPIYKFAEVTAKKNFKDDHFYSSIMFVIGFLLYVPWWLILAGIIWAISGNLGYGIASFVAMPMLGKFAMLYSNQVKRWMGHWRFRSALNRKDEKAVRAAKLRKEIVDWVEGIMLPAQRGAINPQAQQQTT